MKRVKNLKKTISQLMIVIISVFLTTLLTFNVSADGFYSYVYNSNGEVVEAPPAVDVSFTIKFGFKSPQDLIAVENGEIYIADTGNNRVVVTDSNGNVIREIDGFSYNGIVETFNTPKGIFVTENGEIYICDTLNSRIINLNNKGTFIRAITLESGEGLPADFVFTPSKIAVDSTGRIFVVSEGFNNGLLEFTSNGEFIRYMGAPKVSLSASELFWRVFSTKEQREKTSSNVSTEYNNVEIDDEGFLMVTSTAFSYWEYRTGKAEPLRKLNAAGLDVLSRVGNPSGDLTYPDSQTSRASYKGPSAFVDICTLPYGNYGVLDQNRGRVFVYNSDGELLYEFGGPGDVRGGMSTATAIDYSEECFYSLDSAKNQINVYALNSYSKLFNEIAKARNELDFKQEEYLWNCVINENANCELAMRGLGMAAYRKQDMSLAMKYFKQANDTENYSKAYVFVRRQWIEENAVYFVIALIVAMVLIALIRKKIRYYISSCSKDSYPARFDFASYVVFHPIKGFWELKRENRGSVAVASTFVLLTCVIKVASSVATGFLFNNNDIEEYNFLSDILTVLLIVAVWTVIQWCVTVLMDGEGNFKNIFIATGYSLTPYIFLNIVAIILSKVLSYDEAELYTVITVLALIYTVFLLFMGIMSTHNYSLKKTILVIVIILVVIILFIFVVLLVMTIMQQMFAFVVDLYNEISLRV